MPLSQEISAIAGFSLRIGTVVIVDDATENIVAAHWLVSLAISLRDGDLLFETLMETCRIEKLKLFAHQVN